MTEEKPKPKRKRYRQRMQPKQMSLHACFESAFNEIAQLRDEMQENVDNTQESFGETQRFIDTEEALTTLDEIVEQKHSGWEEHLTDLSAFNPEIVSKIHTVNQYTWLKRRGLARWRRTSNTLVALDYGKKTLEEYIDEINKKSLSEVPGSVLESVEALIDMCDVENEMESVEWPRMYG